MNRRSFVSSIGAAVGAWFAGLGAPKLAAKGETQTGPIVPAPSGSPKPTLTLMNTMVAAPSEGPEVCKALRSVQAASYPIVGTTEHIAYQAMINAAFTCVFAELGDGASGEVVNARLEEVIYNLTGRKVE